MYKADLNDIGELWLEAQSLRATDAIQSVVFSLPPRQAPHLPPADQTATLYDDGTTTFVSLFGGKALHEMPLQAVLEVSPNQTGPAGNDDDTVRLYSSEEQSISAGGQDITFVFPSMSGAGIKAPLGRLDPARARLLVGESSEGSADSTTQPNQARYNLIRLGTGFMEAKAAPAAPVAEAPQPSRPSPIVVKEILPGEPGTATVSIETADDVAWPCRVTVLGGAIIAGLADGQPTDVFVHDGEDWQIRKGGTPFQIRISKFDPSSPVTFKVVDAAGREFTIRGTVTPTGPAAQPGSAPRNGR
jgi:hypothetical protein